MTSHPDPDPSPAPGPSALPRFEGRVAIVTGAARGMGRAHALALAREGCDLVICDILEGLPDGTPYPKATRAEFEAVRAAVEQAGRRCIAVQADVADPAASAGLIDAAVETFGRLDYLVANAALTLEGPIVEQTPERFDTVIRANLHGVFNVLAPAMKVMTGRKFGRIVIIGSGASKHAEAAAAPYVASKWGVVGLAKTAALEGAKSGVTVNVVLPGPVDTLMMSSEQRLREAAPDKPDPTREDYLEAKKDATPMGHAWVKAEDVTAAVLFLLSNEARFISGTTLSVDAADSANWN